MIPKLTDLLKEILKENTTFKVGDKVKINHPEEHTGTISSISGDRTVVKGDNGENWNVDVKDLTETIPQGPSQKETDDNQVYEDQNTPTSHAGEESKVYPSLWIAMAGQGGWDKQPQVELKDISWKDAVAKAKKLAKEKKTEVRMSTSKGYNNQGYYFHHQNLNESLTWKKLTEKLNG